ncbi:anti-sigma factor family protein [Hyalangium rubrum]|uniref:Zf-HC2 domain-containing protein n=1 Tax=Hyalangium rubrum TaxID=3103134 RepID=A0ABU5H3N2_9BACT|nr:zf-HC2 domain-containing protein [Hyalangium sp. s54d21]MDY7228063.1 zf-HC2 domain-containing protein [Hyalangium sp. s54d21]
MTCQELDRLLYPYLDGEFQPEERMDVETHLEACSACTRRVEQEREIRQTLRRAARHSLQSSRAPQSLRAGIQVGLKREQRRATQAQFLRVSAAALVVVAVGGGWISMRPERHQRFVEDAARRHAKGLPYEIANAAPEHVEAWFENKLDHTVLVPRLPNARLSGARLSNVESYPAAYISYETRPAKEGEEARRIGVFVFDDARRELNAQDLPSVQADSNTGYNVAIWRDGEIVYELVADLSEADIRKLIQEQERASGLASAPRPAQTLVPVQHTSHVP